MARAAHDPAGRPGNSHRPEGYYPDSLLVDSVTGVDVSLAVAGTGARALAFLIDLLIRSLLVVAWFVVATLIYNRRWSLSTPSDPQGSWYLYVALPATLIYGLYHCLLEIAMRGRTPGKRMVGVRVVTRNGAVPTISAQLVRNVFRLVDMFPVGYGVGLFTSVITRDHVRVGDLAAGTLLVYENRNALGTIPFALPAQGRGLDLTTSELVGELLERWTTLDAEVRSRLARSLLVRATGAAPEDTASETSLREQLERIVQFNRTGAEP
ncbi:MAG: RDD family protein [Gammaproteobacteria bacterium]